MTASTKFVSGVREYPTTDIATIGLGRSNDVAAEIRVLFYEVRLEVIEKPQQIMGDKDLAIAARPCANADGGNS